MKATLPKPESFLESRFRPNNKKCKYCGSQLTGRRYSRCQTCEVNYRSVPNEKSKEQTRAYNKKIKEEYYKRYPKLCLDCKIKILSKDRLCMNCKIEHFRKYLEKHKLKAQKQDDKDKENFAKYHNFPL